MTLPAPERLGPVRLVVTDRRGGVSGSSWRSLNLADHVGDDPAAVAANRRSVSEHLGADGVAVVRAEHGARVHRVAEPVTADWGDALITTVPGLALLALSADCIAAAVCAPDIGAVAVFHSGWRGVTAAVAPATVTALQELGAHPGAMSVRLGPCICPRCYEVSAQVRNEAAAAAPPAASVTRDGAPSVDLVAGVTHQLRTAGVAIIRSDTRCTAEDANLYSYRREGVTGRHGVMAVLAG